MVGFALKKVEKKGFGFSIKKPGHKKAVRKAFGHNEVDEEEKVINIDIVDTKGAYKEAEGPMEETKLVIPTAGNTYKRVLEDKRKEIVEESTQLEYGINFVAEKRARQDREKNSAMDQVNTGEATTQEEYESVPVEEFGAAMLRGMGWKGEESTKDDLTRPKRTLYLGLGAKDTGEEELERMDKTYVPVKLVKKGIT